MEYSENTTIHGISAKKIGEWADLGAYYLDANNTVWYYGVTGTFVNQGTKEDFKKFMHNQRGTFIEF